MKRRWKQTAGFTLVELIVVIAILGVLAGVAVPTYSGYVKKANMAADQTLANDVKNAMQMHYYANPDEAMTGFVVLTPEGTLSAADAVGTDAMDAVFGDGWESTLNLKYDGWAPQLVNGADKINGSSYIKSGTTQLLGGVQQCASALGEFLGKFGADAAGTLASKLDSGENTPFKDMMQAAGYYDAETGTYTNVSTEALGNAAVFSVSDYVSENWEEYLSDKFSSDGFGEPVDLYLSSSNPIYEVACWYAAMEALATHLGGNAEKIWRDGQTQNLDSENVSGMAALEIVQNMQKTYLDMTAYVANDADALEAYKAYYGVDDNFEPIPGVSDTQAKKDAAAFKAMMGTVNDMSDDFANKEDLDNADLITSDAVAGALDAYVNTAENYDALKDIVGDGSCVIVHLLNGRAVVDPGNMG